MAARESSWLAEGCTFLAAALRTGATIRGLGLIFTLPCLFTLGLIWGPPQTWPISYKAWQTVTAGLWVVCALLGLVFAAGKHSQAIKRDFYAKMEEIERDFYAKNEPARADRAHRILGQLLQAAERVHGAGQRQAWDEMVRADLDKLCKDAQRPAQYFHATRAVSLDRARRFGHKDLPLEEDKMDAATRQLRQMLDDLETGEDEYRKWLR